MKRVLVVVVLLGLVAGGVWFFGAGGDSTPVPVSASAPRPEAATSREPGARVPSASAPSAVPKAAGAARIIELAVAPAPPGTLATRVEQLAARARQGEASPGYELAVLLESCIDPLGPGAKIPPECADVPEALLARRAEFRERAAAAGDLRAQATYWAFPPPELRTEEGMFRNPEKLIEFKSRALGYLGAAADAGVAQAMQYLSGVYLEGTLAPADRVLALAYYLAAVTAAPEIDPGQSVRPNYERGLTPQELQRAQELQRGILEGRRR